MSPRRPHLNPGEAAAASYRRSKVMSSTPAELVVVLYERLLADLEGSVLAISSGDLEAKAKLLQRASDVLFELMSSLDRERGGEVSERLAALYVYMISRLGEVSRTRDVTILKELSGLVEALLSAWRVVAGEHAASEPSAPARPQ